MLGLLRNSVPSVHQCVLDKESRELDLRKTSIGSTNTICALLLLIASKKASYRKQDFFCTCVSQQLVLLQILLLLLHVLSNLTRLTTQLYPKRQQLLYCRSECGCKIELRASTKLHINLVDMLSQIFIDFLLPTGCEELL